MLQETKAIALHGVRYGENSLVTYLYSQEHGRITLMVNKAFGAGKVKNKAVYFQPLTLLNLVYYPGKNHGMGRLKEAAPYVLHSEIQFLETKRAIALFMGELIYRTVREEESNPHLYEFLENAIQILDVLEEGVSNFHLVFITQFSKYLGFYPQGRFSAETPFFDFKNGVFTSTEPLHAMFFGQEYSNLLFQLQKVGFSDAHNIKLNHNQRYTYIEMMLRYYSYHMDSVHGIKSLPILSQVFQP